MAEGFRTAKGDVLPPACAGNLDEAVDDLGVLTGGGEASAAIGEGESAIGEIEAMLVLGEAIADGLGNGGGIDF